MIVFFSFYFLRACTLSGIVFFFFLLFFGTCNCHEYTAIISDEIRAAIA